MRSTLKVEIGAVVALAGLLLLGCGNNMSSYPTMPSPTGGGGGGGGTAAVTITIVGMNSDQSFSPNPASVTVGQTVAWVNGDSVTHRIVQDGGAFDTGNIAPGATSAAIVIDRSGTIPYHCSIHPSMVGSVAGVPASGGGPGY